MDGKLLLKVRQRKERVERIKAFLVFPMAALHFAIMPGRVRANELMADSQVGSGFLKKGGDVSIAVGKTISKFKNRYQSGHIPHGYPCMHTTSPAVSGSQRRNRWSAPDKPSETKPGELVNSGILEQAQLQVCDTAARDNLHIHLHPFSRMGHLLVRFWRISLFLLLLWEHPQFAHDSKQALRPAGIAALLQAVPQLHQAKLRTAAAHIPD